MLFREGTPGNMPKIPPRLEVPMVYGAGANQMRFSKKDLERMEMEVEMVSL